MVKKIITIFLLLVFVTQFLPIKKVGQLIAGATMTEELPETAHAKSVIKFLDTKWLHELRLSGSAAGSMQTYYIHFSERIPFHLPGDVQTPPPNIFC